MKQLRLPHLRGKTAKQVKEPGEPRDLAAEQDRYASFRERMMTNAPALVSVAAFAFAIMKVLLIARGNTYTALTVVGRAGPIGVLGGVLVLSLPFISTGLVIVASQLASEKQLFAYERRRLWYYYGFSTFWLSFVAPWFTMALVVGATALNFVFERLHRRNERNRKKPIEPGAWLKAAPEDARLRELWTEYRATEANIYASNNGVLDLAELLKKRARQTEIIDHYNARIEQINARRLHFDVIAAGLLIAAIAPLFQNAINDKPWMPAEAISLQNGERVVGYVLDQGEAWTTILIEENRLVRAVPSGSVKSRQICAVDREAAKPVRTIWRIGKGEGAGYPLCSPRALSPGVVRFGS